MRVAVLLSGRIVTRDCRDTTRTLRKMFGHLDTTYFVSINEDVHDRAFTEQFTNDLNIEEECINIEKTIEPDELRRYRKKSETDYNRTYSMFYHNKKCFELVEKYEIVHNRAFDILIKFRSDICNVRSKNVTFLNVEENVVYIPKRYDYGGINDHIAYGNKQSMRIYCSCADNIKSMCRSDVVFHPETLLREHLRRCNIEIERFEFGYQIMPKTAVQNAKYDRSLGVNIAKRTFEKLKSRG